MSLRAIRRLIATTLCICLVLVNGALQPSALATGTKKKKAATPTASNGCELPFKGSYRKSVKLRKPGLKYSFYNGGRAISVADWFSYVCTLDSAVPAKSKIPATVPMPSEKITIKVRAYVLAMKRDPDNDLHVQIADQASPYKQEQIVIEVPPGKTYCGPRSAIMELFRADGGKSLSGYKFKHPPLIEVTGYLFLDGTHMRGTRGDYCTQNGGRGIKGGLKLSPVRGVWELHPVVELTAVH